eukprot:1159318-Pelagomonas_calceolata.AAC.2
MQVEAHIQQSSSSGTTMLGYYHSDSRMQSVDLPPAGRLVADKISARQPSSFILLLDNKRLAQFSSGDAGQQPFELLTKDGSRGWCECTSPKKLAEGGGNAANTVVDICRK